MPSAKPAVMIDHLAISRLADAAPGSCANTGANRPPARTSTNVRTKRLLTTQASSEELFCAKFSNTQRNDDNRARSGRRRRLVAVRRIVPVLVLMMFDGHRPLQVDDRQEDEDECLQTAGNQSQEHHRERNEKRDERNQDEDDHR